MKNFKKRRVIYMIIFVTALVISFIIGLLTNNLNAVMPKAGILLLIMSLIHIFIEVNTPF